MLFDNEKVAAVRTDQWKFVARSYYREYDVPMAAMGANLLFDVRTDPSENYNVAARHPYIVQDMCAPFERACANFEPLARHVAPEKYP